MEHLDENEMLIEFSEMTAFNFSSEEFQKVRKEYIECKNFVSKLVFTMINFINQFGPVKNY